MGSSSSQAAPVVNGYKATPQHELDFLAGLGDALGSWPAGSNSAPSQSSDLAKYPVPAFLRESNFTDSINIAVTGLSGVGKSLLINTVRGVSPGQPTWSPVGVCTTTNDPRWFEFPDEPRVRLWDLVGVLAYRSLRDQHDRRSLVPSAADVQAYIRAMGLRHFDVVLVLSAGGTADTETEAKVIRELQFSDTPFFFVHTKLDLDIENGRCDCGLSPEQVIQDVRDGLKVSGIPSAYLVNARSVEEHDFPRLTRDILLVIAGRWPNFLRQSAEDIRKRAGDGDESPSSPNVDPASRDERSFGSCVFEIHEGQEPAEHLAALNGRWYFSRDLSFNAFVKNQVGAFAATMAASFLSSTEHKYFLDRNGKWETWFNNALSGYKDTQAPCDVGGGWGPQVDLPFFGFKIRGRGRDFIVDGYKFITEFKGNVHEGSSAEIAKGDFVILRTVREIINGEYHYSQQIATRDKMGTRIFLRFPYFDIANDTSEVVSLSTYSGWSFSPAMTKDLQPGTHIVDCSSKEVRSERAVFTLPCGKKFEHELKAFQKFVLKAEHFQ